MTHRNVSPLLKTQIKRLLALSPTKRSFSIVAACCLVGIIALIVSHAASPTSSIESESGSLSTNASQVTDSTASNGHAVKFNASGVVISGAPVLKVSGANFVDQAGSIVQLAGVNRSGTEFACANQSPRAFTMGPTGSGGGTSPAYAKTTMQALLSWDKAGTPTTGPHAINVVRIPLNEECWLGNGNGISGATAGVTGAPYQQFIKDMVDQATSQQMDVVIDLHWAEANGTMPQGQNIGPNENHSIAFWDSVSKMFGTQKGYTNVAFDLFNEPAIYCINNSTDPNKTSQDALVTNGCPATDYNSSDQWAWNLYQKGTAGTGFTYTYTKSVCSVANSSVCWGDGGYYDARPGQSIAIAGTQELLNAIRANGANNVIIVEALGGGSGYVDMMGSYLPKDTLNPSQVAASVHTYDWGGFGFGSTAAQSSSYAQLNKNNNNIVGHYPLFIGEFGEQLKLGTGTESGACKSATDGFTTNTMSYLESMHWGYTAWTWENNQKCEGPIVVTNNDSGAVSPFGAILKAHLQAIQK